MGFPGCGCFALGVLNRDDLAPVVLDNPLGHWLFGRGEFPPGSEGVWHVGVQELAPNLLQDASFVQVVANLFVHILRDVAGGVAQLVDGRVLTNDLDRVTLRVLGYAHAARCHLGGDGCHRTLLRVGEVAHGVKLDAERGLFRRVLARLACLGE